jgi:hypothetical protein
VNTTAGCGLFLAVCNFLLFVGVGLFASRPFFASQTEIAEIVDYGTEYLQICCCLSFGVYAQLIGEKLLQSTGRPLLSMFSQGLGAIINIVMDPIPSSACWASRHGRGPARRWPGAGQIVAALCDLMNVSGNKKRHRPKYILTGLRHYPADLPHRPAHHHQHPSAP